MNRQSVGFVSIGRSIFPVIKTADDSQIQRAIQRSNPLITSEISEGLVVCYVRETADNLELVTEAHLGPFLMSREDIIKAAKRNLAERAKESMRTRTMNPDNPFYRGILDKKFDSSLMVIDEFWEIATDFVKSEKLAVSIPARNIILFSSPEVVESFEAMRLAASTFYEESIKDELQLTENIYIRENGKWTSLK